MEKVPIAFALLRLKSVMIFILVSTGAYSQEIHGYSYGSGFVPQLGYDHGPGPNPINVAGPVVAQPSAAARCRLRATCSGSTRAATTPCPTIKWLGVWVVHRMLNARRYWMFSVGA